MKEINVTFYEASDGEQFETRERCEQYELALRITEIKKFDLDLNSASYDCCNYMVIRNEEDVEIIKAYCEEFNSYSPWDNDDIPMEYRGIVYFDDNDRWRPFSDKIDEIKQLYAQLNFLADYQPVNEIKW